MPKDACYDKVKAQYDVFPSARASQAIAKCRKAIGAVRKSEEGTSLRRWAKEGWKDTRTGEPCGSDAVTAPSYCRPSKVVSKEKTPSTRAAPGAVAAKARGERAPSTPTPKRK
jgi:hypothetical protein